MTSSTSSTLKGSPRLPPQARKVDFFYLIDAVVQCSLREENGGGPGTPAGLAYPPAVAARAKEIVDAVTPRGRKGRENRPVVKKVLSIWVRTRA